MGDDAEAVVRRYRSPAVTFRGSNAEATEANFDEPALPAKRPPAPSPEARARLWLEERLQNGPVVATDFEDAIDRREFDRRVVERAQAELGLVARRFKQRPRQRRAPLHSRSGGRA